MKKIDLRSDTVTRPTPAMWEAMMHAELGDDVWGDDPTVNRLQEVAAEKLNKEAALFMPSGTMANLTAAMSHCQRGDELIMGDKSHTFRWEAGGVAVAGGIQPHLLPNNPDGTLDLDAIRGAIRADNIHFPRSHAIFLENTHNNCGGVAIPPEYFASVREIADQNGLMVHLDGARIFNACAALKRPVTDFTQYADSVMFCLSKGLCAPVGSILAGSRDFIYRAKRTRKLLGGGMRQVGILAAAGLIALEQMVDRLVEDHTIARTIEAELTKLPGLQVPGMSMDPNAVRTNMVFFRLLDEVPIEAGDFIARLEQEFGVQIGCVAGRLFRLVTHYWVKAEDVSMISSAFRSVLESAGP